MGKWQVTRHALLQLPHRGDMPDYGLAMMASVPSKGRRDKLLKATYQSINGLCSWNVRDFQFSYHAFNVLPERSLYTFKP